jgi:hypothetical protein
MTKTTGPNNGKHLYKWGLLGILPNFGMIAGIILLIKGIFTYRNRTLVFIGIADILFTVGFWMLMNYQQAYGDWFNDSKIHVAKNGLNALVKEIEFHKIKFGQYPEKISELKSDFSFTSSRDPFAIDDSVGKNLRYPYRKINDKYTIHSIGPDHMDGTADDIYPTVTENDSVKFGFVKR